MSWRPVLPYVGVFSRQQSYVFCALGTIVRAPRKGYKLIFTKTSNTGSQTDRPGNSYCRERLSTLDLLIKKAYYVKKKKEIIRIKRS